MPLIKTIAQAQAAGATIFPWQGNQYEVLPFDAMVEIALLADTGDNWLASCFSGTDVLLQASQIDALAIADPILYPDHYSLSDVAAVQERLGCSLTNNTGGIADVRTAVKITPL
jgi:hypothetical protein